MPASLPPSYPLSLSLVIRFSVSVSVARHAPLHCSCCRQLQNLLHVPGKRLSLLLLPPLSAPLLLPLPATEGCTLTGIKSTFYKLTTIFHKNIQNSFAKHTHTPCQLLGGRTFCCHAHASFTPSTQLRHWLHIYLHISQFCLAFLVISLKFS